MALGVLQPGSKRLSGFNRIRKGVYFVINEA